NLLLPGPQASDLTTLDQEVTAGVLRYRRDLGERSSVGVLYTGRVGDDYDNHLLSVDGLTRLSESDSVRYQVFGSSTDYPDAIVTGFGQRGGGFEGHGLLASYTHSEREWYWFGRYAQLSPELRADAGFLPQVGIRQLAGGVQRRIPGDDHSWFSNLYLFVGVDGTREWDGAFDEWGSDVVFTYTGPRQSALFAAYAPNQESFAGTTYRNDRFSVGGEIQPSRDLEVDLEVRWGRAIDFANRRQAEFLTISPQVELYLGRRLQAVAAYARQTFDTVDGRRIFTLDLPQARLVYHFGRRAFVRAILQYRHLERVPENWTFAVDRRDERLVSQLLFSYRLDAQTALLVGYSDRHLGDDSFDLSQSDRTVFLKIGYAWLF
ncbi:MAG TPA: hypothetical protein VMT16_02115, partial [Thermoanaerobaculia bacterium]|nr:hypothetical protein [Thermoanaerobaculia bacterium]